MGDLENMAESMESTAMATLTKRAKVAKAEFEKAMYENKLRKRLVAIGKHFMVENDLKLLTDTFGQKPDIKLTVLGMPNLADAHGRVRSGRSQIHGGNEEVAARDDCSKRRTKCGRNTRRACRINGLCGRLHHRDATVELEPRYREVQSREKNMSEQVKAPGVVDNSCGQRNWIEQLGCMHGAGSELHDNDGDRQVGLD